jgi:ribosomal-protein-alanine N-acetyltransferase
MYEKLSTPRLILISLSSSQLRKCLENPSALEAELGFSIAKGVIDANVVRAINMKLSKMVEIDVRFHDWLTYWLIVIKQVLVGAGLIGFKGYPDSDGKSEVGCGIDPAYQNKGYMTEALKALSEWAFSNPDCKVLTATTVINPASDKVLLKTGWKRVRQENESLDWELHR